MNKRIQKKRQKRKAEQEAAAWEGMPILYSCVTTPLPGYGNQRMRFSFIPDLDSDWYQVTDENGNPTTDTRPKFQGRVALTAWYNEGYGLGSGYDAGFASRENARNDTFDASCHSLPFHRGTAGYLEGRTERDMLRWLAKDVPGLEIG